MLPSVARTRQGLESLVCITGGERPGKSHPSQAVSLTSAFGQQKGNIQLKLILSFQSQVSGLKNPSRCPESITLKRWTVLEAITHPQTPAEYCCVFSTAVYNPLVRMKNGGKGLTQVTNSSALRTQSSKHPSDRWYSLFKIIAHLSLVLHLLSYLTI